MAVEYLANPGTDLTLEKMLSARIIYKGVTGRSVTVQITIISKNDSNMSALVLHYARIVYVGVHVCIKKYSPAVKPERMGKISWDQNLKRGFKINLQVLKDMLMKIVSHQGAFIQKLSHGKWRSFFFF